MSTRKTILTVFAFIFGILAIVLYFTSIKEVDRDTARYLGVSAVANIQGTVFASACAVMCCINVVGSVILSEAEEHQNTGSPSSSYIASEVAKELKRLENEEKRIKEKEINEQIEREKRKEEAKKRIAEINARKESGDLPEEESFIEEIAEETSMIEIWKIWNKYKLSDIQTEADKFINEYKEIERLYGRIDLNKFKEKLRSILLP